MSQGSGSKILFLYVTHLKNSKYMSTIIIIIRHDLSPARRSNAMTSPHQGGAAMANLITHAELSNINTLGNIRTLCLDLDTSSCTLVYSLPQPHQVTVSTPLPVINHQSILNHLHLHKGSPLLPIFRVLSGRTNRLLSASTLGDVNSKINPRDFC